MKYLPAAALMEANNGLHKQRHKTISLSIHISVGIRSCTRHQCQPSPSVPRGHQQEVAHIFVMDSALAHVDVVQGNDIFGEVIFNRIKCAKFSLYRFFRGQQIGNLNVHFFSIFFADKIDFTNSGSADRHTVSIFVDIRSLDT